MALSYYALKNTRIGSHDYAVGDLVAEADLNGRGPYLVKRGLVAADGGSGGGGGGGLVRIGNYSNVVSGWDSFEGNTGIMVTDCFSPTYDAYRVIMDGTAPDMPRYMLKTILTNDGVEPNYNDETYFGFSQGNWYGPGYSLPPANWVINSDVQSYKWVPGHIGAEFSITMEIWNPANTRGKRFLSQGQSMIAPTDWATDGNLQYEAGGGFNNSASTFDGALFFCSGILATLNISIYGYAKA